MKKYLQASVFVAMILSVVGCGGSSEAAAEGETETDKESMMVVTPTEVVEDPTMTAHPVFENHLNKKEEKHEPIYNHPQSAEPSQ